MYAQQSLQDYLFLMLYGATAMLAMAAGIYLWFRRSNTFAPDVTPPKALRRWTAAFFITMTLSHVWWYVLGVHWLTEDRLVRNITAVLLDRITIIPLAIAMLLHILQDYRRKLWPWVLAQMPTIAAAAIGIIKHDQFYGLNIMDYYQMAVVIIFVVYYTHALRRYGRWLHENFADLEHKEVWQSLLFVVILFVVYEVYSTNPGEMVREYMAQLNTMIIIAFLLWRVETLQELVVKENEEEECVAEQMVEANNPIVTIPSNIGILLQKFCEESHFYLQHDLTLAQLSNAIGTNRTYLSQYFAQQGTTYNTYVNRMRIEHFEHLYQEAVSSSRIFTAQQLAFNCGFRSYSTFSAAFKQFKGQTVTTWMKEHPAP